MHKCPCINVLDIEMEARKGEGNNQTNRKFGKLNQWKICISGFLSAERSPILGSVSIFKTFMCGHLCMVMFLHLQTGDANFPLIQFSPSPILGSVSMFKTFMHGHLCVDIYVW